MIEYVVMNHACVRLQGSIVVYTDPYKLTEAPHDADLVLITHSHFDHYSPEDIAKVSNDDTLVITPKDIKHPGRSFGLVPSDQLGLDQYVIEAVPAYNIGKDYHPREKNWLGYVLKMDGKFIYFAGDTDDTPEAEEVRCDLAFLPVGGTYTCNVEEAVHLAKAIGAQLTVPYHYGEVAGSPEDGARFIELLNE